MVYILRIDGHMHAVEATRYVHEPISGESVAVEGVDVHGVMHAINDTTLTGVAFGVPSDVRLLLREAARSVSTRYQAEQFAADVITLQSRQLAPQQKKGA